ncbi:hypothetical protein V1290_003786 [Bradyrhizobium sp. AZCC 1578]|uniref:hypothetical protein n=1 Tax=Bradyrhizobium sp. AZCC 1578 TaxID=3117027 RepID=UPI002FEED314
MIDPTEKAIAVSDFRMRFLRLNFGGTETSDASVPEDRRDDFREQVQYNREFAARWFEESCRYFGASDGTWATVPEENRSDALRYFGRKIAKHDNRCQFELDLLKIDLQEKAEDAAMDFG